MQSSKTNKNKFFKIESNCDYFSSYGRKPVSEGEKCSNHLARCEVTKCSTDVWKYHMSQHCRECNNLMAFPEELKISEQENFGQNRTI